LGFEVDDCSIRGVGGCDGEFLNKVRSKCGCGWSQADKWYDSGDYGSDEVQPGLGELMVWGGRDGDDEIPPQQQRTKFGDVCENNKALHNLGLIQGSVKSPSG